MPILLFNGSPREGGNTDILLQHVAKGIKQEGREAERINLAQLDIHPCTACGSCEATGECIWDDDMQMLYRKIPLAPRIVIGSPIYFYGVTAQTKAFIDRCQVFWSRKYLLNTSSPKPSTRKGFLVCVGASKGNKMFDCASLTVQYTYDAMDVVYCGDLFIRSVDQKGAILDKKEQLKAAEVLGREICS